MRAVVFHQQNQLVKGERNFSTYTTDKILYPEHKKKNLKEQNDSNENKKKIHLINQFEICTENFKRQNVVKKYIKNCLLSHPK